MRHINKGHISKRHINKRHKEAFTNIVRLIASLVNNKQISIVERGERLNGKKKEEEN